MAYIRRYVFRLEMPTSEKTIHTKLLPNDLFSAFFKVTPMIHPIQISVKTVMDIKRSFYEGQENSPYS